MDASEETESRLDRLDKPPLEHIDRSDAGVVAPDSQLSSEKEDKDDVSVGRE